MARHGKERNFATGCGFIDRSGFGVSLRRDLIAPSIESILEHVQLGRIPWPCDDWPKAIFIVAWGNAPGIEALFHVWPKAIFTFESSCETTVNPKRIVRHIPLCNVSRTSGTLLETSSFGVVLVSHVFLNVFPARWADRKHSITALPIEIFVGISERFDEF